MRIAELIEGEIFHTFFLRGTKPFVDKPSSSLDIIGLLACERDKMDRVIPEIVEDSKSSFSLAIDIDEPLSHSRWIDSGDLLVVANIVALVPVFYFSFLKCFDKFALAHSSDSCS